MIRKSVTKQTWGGHSCGSLGYYGGNLSCSSCGIETSDCENYGYCGDGIVDTASGERCDANVATSRSCADEGYALGDLWCNQACDGYSTRFCYNPASISNGLFHSCMVDTLWQAYCWGSNAFGELGNGGGADRESPVPVLGGTTFQSISVGEFFSCAVTNDGTNYCLGSDFRGKLGNGALSDSIVPSPVDF